MCKTNHKCLISCRLCSFGVGDNLHTAISVARDCDMIKEGHKVIVLQATDNGEQGVSLNYTYVGEDVSSTDEVKSITGCYSDESLTSISFKVHSIDCRLVFAWLLNNSIL